MYPRTFPHLSPRSCATKFRKKGKTYHITIPPVETFHDKPSLFASERIRQFFSDSCLFARIPVRHISPDTHVVQLHWDARPFQGIAPYLLYLRERWGKHDQPCLSLSM